MAASSEKETAGRTAWRCRSSEADAQRTRRKAITVTDSPERPLAYKPKGRHRHHLRRITMQRRSLLLAFGGVSLIGACASVDTEQTTTVTAVVETVDPNSRELLVRGDAGAQSGRLLSMVVSPRVQRLNQIRPGDHVTVTYYQAIAANLVNVFSGAAPPPADTLSLYRGETATRPNGELTR